MTYKNSRAPKKGSGQKSRGFCKTCKRETRWEKRNGCWVCLGNNNKPHNPTLDPIIPTAKTKDIKKIRFCRKCNKHTEQTYKWNGNYGAGFYCRCGKKSGC